MRDGADFEDLKAIKNMSAQPKVCKVTIWSGEVPKVAPSRMDHCPPRTQQV